MTKICRMLVVDDEWYIRDGIATYPWEKFGCKVVGSAENGEEALEMVKMLQPDMVITDIKMPGMDGLAFIKEAKEIMPEMEVILLTGYSDFEFAKTAVQLGVTDYILKPTNFDELEKTVLRLSEKIRRSGVKQEYYETLKSRYESALSILNRYIVSSLLHHSNDNNPAVNNFRKEIQAYKYIVVSGIMLNSGQVIQEKNLNQELLAFEITNICEEIFNKYSERILSENDSGAFHFILLFCNEMTDDACLDITLRAVTRISDVIQSYLKGKMNFGISSVGSDPDVMHLYYEKLTLSWNRHRFYSDQVMVMGRDDGQNYNDSWLIPEDVVNRIVKSLVGYDEDAVYKAVSELFRKARDSHPEPDVLKTSVVGLLIHCISIVSNGKNNELSKPMREIVSEINTCHQIAGLQSEMELFIEKLLEYRDKNDIMSQHAIVQRAIEYLEAHYQEDISLADLASNLHVSASYLSKLMKSGTQKNFSEIVVDIRIQKAQELIESKQYKIYEIADLVGFRNNSYFTHVFKKRVGMTPKEYKVMLHGQ